MRIGRALLVVALVALAAVPVAESAQIRPRVVGGDPADIAAMPWMASIVASSASGGSWLCGGTVVGARYVLTAAHCVVDRGAVVAARRVGGAVGRATLSGSDGTAFAVDAVAVHPLYARASTAEGGPYDAALLHVDRDLPVTPLRLATTADAAAYAAGVDATIAGWGATASGGGSSDVLRTATVPIVDEATCARENGITAAEARKMICAGYEGGGIDTCQGDSGGPLTVTAGAEPIVAGIVSWGFECAAPLHPGVYTRVATIAPWAAPLLAGDAEAWTIATDVRAPRVRPSAARSRRGVVGFRYRVLGETGRTRETITIRRSRTRRALRSVTTVLAANHRVSVVRWRVPRVLPAGRYVWCVTSTDENRNVSPMRCAALEITRP